MSFFSKLMAKVYQTVVEDEFTQSLQEHEVLAVINQQRDPSHTHSMLMKKHSSISTEDVLQIIQAISDNTPEIEFRLLGYDPNVEAISNRSTELKKKLSVVEGYLLENSEDYLQKINLSLNELQDLRQFYNGRMKAQQLRSVIGRLKLMLDCGKRITRLNIIAKNLKETLKLLQRIPNIKKMNLIELKAISWQNLSKMSQQISSVSPTGNKLVCIQNLYNYITKINNEEFIYIIDKIKLSFDGFDSTTYEEVIRNYMVISPNTTLEKLICSLLQQKLRAFQDINAETVQDISKLGQKIINVITNLHKIIKWHRVNKAVRYLNKGSPIKNVATTQEEEQRNRCLSFDSVYSEEGKANIELNDLVLIDSSVLKSTFSRTIDFCLADLMVDNLLSEDLNFCKFYQYTYLMSRIAEICFNFTGISFEKLRKVIADYCAKQEFAIYLKSAKELIASLQFEKNQWNRSPVHNNFRSKGLDKFMFRVQKMRQLEEFKKADKSVLRLFQPKERDVSEVKRLLQESEDNEQQDGVWELSPVIFPSFDKLDKGSEQWIPGESYLQFNEGDAILCQSSFKMLSILQRYFEMLMFIPRNEQFQSYFSHLLILVEFYMFYLFNTFLTTTYKQIFYEDYKQNANVDRKYTKKRLLFLYPYLSNFVVKFKGEIEKIQSNQLYRFYGIFKKDINEMKGENNQVLRAKVIATESCKYVLAYTEEMMKRLLPLNGEANRQPIWQRLETYKLTINELSTILLTESSQKMVGIELQTMRSLFQSIRWHEPFEDLKDYINKLGGLVRQAYERLKSSNRGEIPLNLIFRIFVLVWRTLLTYAIKLFLEGKTNNRREAKLNFQKFLDEMYMQFNNSGNKQLSQLQPAYKVFKSIFSVLLCKQQAQCRQVLLETMKKFDYIFQILMSLLDNCQYMQSLSQKQRQRFKSQLKQQIEAILDEKKDDQ